MSGNLRRGVCIRRVYSYRTERIRVNNPEPLSEIRKNLTEPSNPPASQSCTLLTRLPIEVRLQIWTYILGNKTLHIELLPGRLASQACENCCEDDEGCHAQWHHYPVHRAPKVCQSANLGVVPLLRVCQQVYNETSDLLYSTNTIDVSDLGILKYFVQGVPPERLSSIRRLRVHWQDESWLQWPRMIPNGHVGFGGTWEMFWRLAFAELRGLIEITIIICTCEEENYVLDQALQTFSSQRQLLEWDFRWEPQAKTRCRFVQGKKKTVDVQKI
ncbi:MAG: hypothetical protein Q9184_005632 [Pyrenodesmia sp. 2 TL-2023]